MSRHLLARLALAGALGLLAGCGTLLPGAPHGSPPGADQIGPAAGGAAAADAASSLCSIFTPAELEALIKSSPEGLPLSGEFGGSACQWEDPDDTGNRTLTVEVGAAGSAPGGRLQPFPPERRMEALTDGMARDRLGRVYFVCGSSSECVVGITGLGSNDNEVKAGVDLVPTIRTKVGG